MNHLEQFNGNQDQGQVYKTGTWESKKTSEQLVELEKSLIEINEEIHKLENPASLSYFKKVLRSVNVENKQNKLTLLYQKRHATEAILEKLRENKTIH